MTYQNAQIIFDSYADGLPKVDNFTSGTETITQCDADKIIVRNHYLSVDPAQKGWMSSAVNYASATLGEAMRALAVGEIVESNLKDYQVGEFVTGWFGWQEYAHVGAEKIQRKVDPDMAPIKYAISIFGLNGLTAYIALKDIIAPKSDDTILVSTAAGGVGSIVGQLAREFGCHVIGLTGSDAKVERCCNEYGYDDAINYKSENWLKQLQQACPKGIDGYFDMTGGWITDNVIDLMNHSSVHAQVGTAAVASWDPVPVAPRRERVILVKEMTQKGFIIFNHEHRFEEASNFLAAMLEAETLNFRENIHQGLASAPTALESLYQGDNTGKVIISLLGQT